MGDNSANSPNTVTRFSQYARVPVKDWNEARPRVVQRNIGYSEFVSLMGSRELMAVVVLATHERIEGELAYGEVTQRSTGDYELIYRDDLTGKLERRVAFEIEAVTARVALEKRLDLLSSSRVYVNPSLIGQVVRHGSITSIAPQFEDGSHADERIKLPIQHHILMRMLELEGYQFNGPRLVVRPAAAPRRATLQEQYMQVLRGQQIPKVEW